jgi:sigma-B regulation protein RsbU (phosphoserine phosphatase)
MQPTTPTEADPDSPAPARGGWALDLITRSWAGRAILIGGCVKLLATLFLRVVPDNFFVEVIGTAGTLALLIGAAYFVGRLIGLARRRLLWRVRRKLILSYIFVGLVPALLIVIFFLVCGVLLFGAVSQYVIETRLKSAVEQDQFLVRSTASDLSRLSSEAEAREYLERKQRVLAERYPEISFAAIPVGRSCAGPASDARMLQISHTVSAGPWSLFDPPETLPDWVPCAGFAGLVAYSLASGDKDAADDGTHTVLAIRAAALPEGSSPRFVLLADVPIGQEAVNRLRQDTGIELRDITARTTASPVKARRGLRAFHLSASDMSERLMPPWVVFTEFTDWPTGRRGMASLAIGMSIADIYNRLSPRAIFGRDAFAIVVLLVGVLFLIIQFFALVVGFALAQSITGSVHQLFIGTERVQQGDFSHRIEVNTRDQLGELADSFNSMTSRLTGLLAEMAEKKRLEEELRIARKIQMSLLPQGQVQMPGLLMTANCTPAREVGGDYYDFLPLDDRRIGILIADVSGKGTSAALYMAELKGLMLSLCQIHRSPRDLLIAANRIIADNLDSRSFITMIYAVMDMEAKTMTYARAGHTPLIHLPACGPASRQAEILTSGGMVLGLKFDNGEKFAELLQESTLPLAPGDVFVLFTDGISEAMNAEEELFGEERLSELVADHSDLPFEELRERIFREVRAFAGEPGPHDDMTLILLKVEPPAMGAPSPAVSVAAL